MKKIFIEPEIVRIDLKMTENIADSSTSGNLVPWDYEYGIGFWITTSVSNYVVCYENIFATTEPAPSKPVSGTTTSFAWSVGCLRWA